MFHDDLIQGSGKVTEARAATLGGGEDVQKESTGDSGGSLTALMAHVLYHLCFNCFPHIV